MAKATKTKTPAMKNPSLSLTAFTSAAIADAIAATGSKKSGSLLRVPVDQIMVMPGFNIRIDNEAYRDGIAELAASIEVEGYYDSHPLSCFAAEIDGVPKIVIIDGHRRKAAVDLLNTQGAEITTLPVVLKKPTVTDLDLAVSLDKENNAVELSMLERAVLAKRMLKADMTRGEVAERLGKSDRYVGDLITLIEAPKSVRDLVRDGIVGAYEAIARMKQPGGVDKIIELGEKNREKAAAKGTKSERMTRSAIDNDGVKPPRMKVIRDNFKTEAGAVFQYEDVEPFLALIGDDTWFKPARKKGERIALSDLSVEVTIRRPKTDEEVEADAQARATRKNGAVAAGLAVPDEALEDDEAEDVGETPDLRELDIADPADAGL